MTDRVQTGLDCRDTHCIVLVVDDEPVIRELVAMFLEDEGYTVRQACDGLEALREVDTDEVDLVLSDVKMPRLDGVTLARRLAAREPSVPIVLMSAVAPQGMPAEVPFLRKPFALDHLIAVIAAALPGNGRSPAVGRVRHHIQQTRLPS
jgi:two-component system, sensor histidine kinase and response regulator